MKEDQLDIVKTRLADISDYSLAQFFALALGEMLRRGLMSKDTTSQALWELLKDCDPNHGA